MDGGERGRVAALPRSTLKTALAPSHPAQMHSLLLLASLLAVAVPPASGEAFYGPRPAGAPPPSRWATTIKPDPAYEPLM